MWAWWAVAAPMGHLPAPLGGSPLPPKGNMAKVSHFWDIFGFLPPQKCIPPPPWYSHSPPPKKKKNSGVATDGEDSRELKTWWVFVPNSFMQLPTHDKADKLSLFIRESPHAWLFYWFLFKYPQQGRSMKNVIHNYHE